jgi:hypothetical protein
VHIFSDVVAEVVLEKRMVELFLSWLVWLGLAIVVGVAASHRGRNGVGWFFLAVVITPLIAGLLVLVLPDANIERQQQEIQLNSRKCPFCAELVRREAIVCKHCGRDLPPDRDIADEAGRAMPRTRPGDVAADAKSEYWKEWNRGSYKK